MKSVILMTTLIIFSIFAGVVVFAETENLMNDNSDSIKVESEAVAVSLSSLESTEIETEDVEVSLQEIEAVEGYKRIGFAKVWKGNGWIDNNKEGYLITGFWASQKLAKVDTSNKEIEKIKTIRTSGRLNIVGIGSYRLVRAPTTDEIENLDSINFYVIPLNKKKYLEEADLSRDAVGKLKLDRREQFEGLTKWLGTLSFEEGKLAGSWSVEFGTNVHTIKPVQLKKIRRIQGEVQATKVRMNNAIAIKSSKNSEEEKDYVMNGEISSEETEKEIQIKPIMIKRHKIWGFIPTNKKILEVEITKAGKIYRERIKANGEMKIEDYKISVGDLENEEDIELKVE